MATASKTKRAKPQPPNRQLLEAWTERTLLAWMDRLLNAIEHRAAWGYTDPNYNVPRIEWLNGQVPYSALAPELHFFHTLVMARGHEGWRRALNDTLNASYRNAGAVNSHNAGIALLRRVFDATPAVGRVSGDSGDIHILHPPRLVGRVFSKALCLRIHSAAAPDGLVVGFAPLSLDDDTFLLPCPVPRTVWLDTHISSSRKWLDSCTSPEEEAVNLVFMTSTNHGSWFDWQRRLIDAAVTPAARPSRYLPDIVAFVDDEQRRLLAASIVHLAQPSAHRIARTLITEWSMAILQHAIPRRHFRYAMASPAELSQMLLWYGQVLREMLSRMGVVTPLAEFEDTDSPATWARLEDAIDRVASAWERVTQLRKGAPPLPFAADQAATSGWMARPGAYALVDHLPPVLDLWKSLAQLAPDPPTADGSKLSRRVRAVVATITGLPADAPLAIASLPDEAVLATTRGVGHVTLDEIRQWIHSEFQRWRSHVTSMAERERPSAELTQALDDLLDVFDTE